jgi:hypothetical protein
MKKGKTLIITIPLMILLIGLFAYRYGYLRLHAEISTIEEEYAVKTKTLEKYAALISEKPMLEERLKLLKETRDVENSKLLEGQTPSLAAAALQDIVRGIITGRGGTVSSERVGKLEEMGKFKVINVSIDAVLPDSRVLGDVLYSIETRTPYLIVKDLDARIRNQREPKEIMVKLDVYALFRGK